MNRHLPVFERLCAWIGNSRAVAQQHYLQVTDEHFERAAVDRAEAAQNPAQQTAAEPRTASFSVEESAICGEKRGIAIPNEYLMGAAGFEPA